MSERNLSPEDGWIDAQVVRNVFQTTMRKVDETIPSSDRFPVKELIAELFEKAKYEILKHRKSVSEIVAKRAEVKGEPLPNQKEAHDKRMQGIRGRS